MSLWVGLAAAAGALVAIVAAVGGVVMWRLDRESPTPATIVNAGGKSGRALLLYQPGLTRFPTDVARSFADGLAVGGWEITVSTISAKAPVADNSFNLLVLASPVYGGRASRHLARYLERMLDLKSKPVVTLLTGGGDTEGALALTEKLVLEANGRPVRSLGLWSMRPNDEAGRFAGSNQNRARQMAREAAMAWC